MKVWVVERRASRLADYSYITDVFDSEEKANEYAKKHNERSKDGTYFKVDGPHEVR